MSYKILDHATDAFIEVTAKNLEEGFQVAAQSVIETTLDPSTIQESEQKNITVSGKDLRYLLFNWLEELVFLLITEGFAIKRTKVELEHSVKYTISAIAYGEPIDLSKHKFKVEIKAPTFYEMEIDHNDTVRMKFLLDL